MTTKDYHSIPGTFVFDSDHSRQGYPLNMFMMSLNKSENRSEFLENEVEYLKNFTMSDEQRDATLGRDWNGMLELGGNVYYTLKLAATDGLAYEEVYALMAGQDRDEFRKMMLSGGRTPSGNLYKNKRE